MRPDPFLTPELGMTLMGATGGILGDTIGAAGPGIWDGISCEK